MILVTIIVANRARIEPLRQVAIGALFRDICLFLASEAVESSWRTRIKPVTKYILSADVHIIMNIVIHQYVD